MSRAKYRLSSQKVYWMWMYTKVLSHVDMHFWQDCSRLILPQWHLAEETSLHSCLWLSSFHCYQVALLAHWKVKTVFSVNLECNTFLNSIDVYSYWGVVCQDLIHFDDILKIILNIWYRIKEFKEWFQRFKELFSTLTSMLFEKNANTLSWVSKGALKIMTISILFPTCKVTLFKCTYQFSLLNLPRTQMF